MCKQKVRKKEGGKSVPRAPVHETTKLEAPSTSQIKEQCVIIRKT